ncbi:MAG: hypothetical protein M3R06_10330 [Chloroflexota bacterium]|nr:hypothetical protein [Chloroflexota bacterium]
MSWDAAKITIANRDTPRAEALAADFTTPQLGVRGIGLEAIDRVLAEVSVLVNATAVGWNLGESPMPLGLLNRLPATAVVNDLIYRETDLLRAARLRGLRILDGLPMLVHQAAGAFTRWTGLTAPLPEMLEAGENARAARR